MNDFRLTGTPRLRRGMLVAVSAFTLVSCATAIETDSPQATVSLFAVGYKNISDRYIEQVDLGRVSIAGLNSLSQVDPNLSVSREANLVRLSAANAPAAQWPVPETSDAAGWAKVISQAVDAARAVSPEARRKSSGDLSNVVFRGVMTKFDRYSRYSEPSLAIRNRAMREGFGGLGITIRYDNGATHVDKVHPDTPAARAGLRPKDVITRVDGLGIEGLSQPDVIDVLRGDIGSEAKLVVRR